MLYGTFFRRSLTASTQFAIKKINPNLPPIPLKFLHLSLTVLSVQSLSGHFHGFVVRKDFRHLMVRVFVLSFL